MKQKKLIVINESDLLELGNGDKCISRFRDEKFKENTFSKIKYDQDTKYLILASSNENVPTIRLCRFNAGNDITEFSSFQANSRGITSMNISNDMSHLFTVGRDHCLFIFQFQNIQKPDKRDDTLDTDIILVKKEDLDKDNLELNYKILKFEREKVEEEEKQKKIEADIDKENRSCKYEFR